MTEKYQKNRIYSLIVGTKDDAVEINNLQMKFKVTKTSSNKDKKNAARVEIYNLSEERRKKLEEPYVQVSFSVGYSDTGLAQLFTGQIINIATSKVKPFLSKRSGTDIITVLDIDELYEELHGIHVSKLIPSGATVGEAIRAVAKDMDGVKSVQMNGGNVSVILPDGYPLSGPPIKILNDISFVYHIDWQIDNGVLYISDGSGTFDESKDTVPLIGQFSGLIERPEYENEEAKRMRREVEGKSKKYTNPKPNSLKLKILLNPTIVAGSTIKLDFENISGYYKVNEVEHSGDFSGNEWYSKIRCVEKG